MGERGTMGKIREHTKDLASEKLGGRERLLRERDRVRERNCKRDRVTERNYERGKSTVKRKKINKDLIPKLQLN